MDFVYISMFYVKYIDFYLSYTAYTFNKNVSSTFFSKNLYSNWRPTLDINMRLLPLSYIIRKQEFYLKDVLEKYWPYRHTYHRATLDSILFEKLVFKPTSRLGVDEFVFPLPSKVKKDKQLAEHLEERDKVHYRHFKWNYIEHIVNIFQQRVKDRNQLDVANKKLMMLTVIMKKNKNLNHLTIKQNLLQEFNKIKEDLKK